MSTTNADFPADDVPEADWAEQHTEVAPDADEIGRLPARLAGSESEANEADLVDQRTVAYEDDDER